MPEKSPPTMDATAAQRWAQRPPSEPAWLHEEVARRMQKRLECIVAQPQTWLDWEPLNGGIEGHALLRARYPQSQCYVMETPGARARAARTMLAPAWWRPARWGRRADVFGPPQSAVDMVWANMALHMVHAPLPLLTRWLDWLKVDGFVMFSCLGPDTLGNLRALYASQGWTPPAHEFTDMHDWGDLLIEAGFSDPVMDMERISLTFSSPQTALAELRTLGRNLHPKRFAGLRGRRWHAQLQSELRQSMQNDGMQERLTLDFEIIYGHAFKAAPKLTVRPQTSVSLEDMRRALHSGKKNPADF